MKKAYNVRGLCEKASSALKVFSLLAVFFLGFQSQSVAQAAFPDAINPDGVQKSDLKELANDYDFSAVSSEDVIQKLKAYGAPIMATTATDPVGEVEQEFTIGFMRALSVNISQGGSISDAVNRAYTTVMGSDLVAAHGDDVDFVDLVEDVLEAID